MDAAVGSVLDTLLDLADAPVPAGLEGRSFAPLLRGESFEGRDEVAGGIFYDVSYDPAHFLRTGSPMLGGHVQPSEEQRVAFRTYHPRSARSAEEIAQRRKLV